MKNELTTFNFRVKGNFNKYVGTKFCETHILPENVNKLEWAKRNLPTYFSSDFELTEIN